MTDSTNDNELSPAVSRKEGPAAHGQAALLLVESLIHILIARSVIGREDAIELVTVAIDVTTEISVDRGDSDETFERSIAPLSAIRQSLCIDSR